MDEETEWKEWSRAPKKIMTCLVGTLEGASIYWTLNPCFSTSGCVGGCRHLEYLFRKKKKRRTGGPCLEVPFQCRSRHVWDLESEATCKHDVMMLSLSRWISFRTTVFQDDLAARPVSDSGDHLEARKCATAAGGTSWCSGTGGCGESMGSGFHPSMRRPSACCCWVVLPFSTKRPLHLQKKLSDPVIQG